MHCLKIKSKLKNYEVKFVDYRKDVLETVNDANVITFVDSTVSSLYKDLDHSNFIKVECNEEAKTFLGSQIILNELIKRKANISTKLIVIGGGVLQDLVGYCASIYCRGIDYILVPTTLLAQADSCVGGKTSINYGNRKNILGTFFPPSQILIDINFTKTLSKHDYISGLGEIYKFHILQGKVDEFNANGSVYEMVLDSLKYKSEIISEDEFDKDKRRFLNFGHTFGHALEAISNYNIPHGLAVILGSMIAVTLSKRLGYEIPQYEMIIKKGIQLFRSSSVSLKEEWFIYEKLKEIIKSDKKSKGNLTMVLIDKTPLLTDVTDDCIIPQILKEVYESI